MTITPDERKLLDEIEPYVLMSASLLISCAYRGNYAEFDLLARPQVYRTTASGGFVNFEVPEQFPVEHALLSTANGKVHSVVKHLHLPRKVRAGSSGMQVHRFGLGQDLCSDGENAGLTYSPWFRFAAPPYRFEIQGQASAYVGAALAHLARVKGLSVQADLKPDLSVLRLSDQLRVELIGAAELTEVAVLLGTDETSISFANPQLSVARRMFPDMDAAVRSAAQAGERFRGASLIVEADQVLIYADSGASDVQA